MSESKDLQFEFSLDVDDRVGKSKSEMTAGIFVEKPEDSGIHTHFRNQAFHFCRESAGKRPALAFVVLNRRQKIGLCLRV